MPERIVALRTWAREALGGQPVELAPASADASFRRYFRVRAGAQSWIIMDAPPEQEDCAPFIQVAGLLRAAGLHAPEVLAHDPAQGFLLLTDLGAQTYLDVLDEGNADALFADAVQALLQWQQASRPRVLPSYDRALLRRELDLFPDWYLDRHLHRHLTTGERHTLAATFTLLEDSALAQPQVFVHRDFMPRNLMVSAPNPGILDFQDAVLGPITYDVLSLFKDAFISWPAERLDKWLRDYWQQARKRGLPVPEPFTEFQRAFDWMGVQRHLKVIGIFARICHRDGKPQYLKDVPRFFTYIREVAPRYTEFTPLLKLLDSVEKGA